MYSSRSIVSRKSGIISAWETLITGDSETFLRSRNIISLKGTVIIIMPKVKSAAFLAIFVNETLLNHLSIITQHIEIKGIIIPTSRVIHAALLSMPTAHHNNGILLFNAQYVRNKQERRIKVNNDSVSGRDARDK